MRPIVTIGIPVYRRLEYLAFALRSVAAQDYPEIELIVSDNGPNDSKVLDIVESHYFRPFKFRQNSCSVSSAEHFNQIIAAASGKYFVLLADDDEISPTFVSDLCGRLEQDESAALAISAQEVIDRDGTVVARSSGPLPKSLSGTELIRAAWRTHEYKFQCFATHLCRTEVLRETGGFPDFTGATHDDDAVLVRLSLGRAVAFSNACVFRWRVYDESLGWSISVADLASASKEFLSFLRSDPTIRAFASERPAEWAMARSDIQTMVYDTYFGRWRGMYRQKMSRMKWLVAGFNMPPNSKYYGRVGGELGVVAWDFVRDRLNRLIVSRVARSRGGPGGAGDS